MFPPVDDCENPHRCYKAAMKVLRHADTNTLLKTEAVRRQMTATATHNLLHDAHDTAERSSSKPPSPTPASPSPHAAPDPPRSMSSYRSSHDALEAPALPPEWERIWSKTRKRYYYRDRLSNKTSWELPCLPPNWSTELSKEHNRYYFYNTISGETSWQFPVV